MEQTPYWMWAKQNPSNDTSTNTRHHHLLHQHHHQRRAPGSTSMPMAYASHEDPSWEEQAFAEDATGAFGGGGGCVWPPRSYSCSFCRREFRSAQALGGHMNVHRRDRARLKQSSSPSSISPNNHQSQLLHDHHVDQYHHHHHHQHQPPVCALVYHQQQNPNDHDHDGDGDGHVLASSSWPAPRVCDHQEHHSIIRSSPHVVASRTSPTTTWANFVVGRSQNNNTSEYPKPSNNLNCVKTDLSVSLSLVLHPAMLPDRDGDDHEEAMVRSCKKRKRNDTDDSSSFPIFLKPKIQAFDDRAEEELDLELRLGDRPDKVKQNL